MERITAEISLIIYFNWNDHLNFRQFWTYFGYTPQYVEGKVIRIFPVHPLYVKWEVPDPKIYIPWIYHGRPCLSREIHERENTNNKDFESFYLIKIQ